MNKPLPNDQDAERAVIGSVVLANTALDVIATKASDFYDARHRVIFQQLRTMWDAGHRALDAVTLAEALESAGLLEKAGGASYLNDVCLANFEVVHVRYYAGIVEAKSQLRQVIQACTLATGASHANDKPENVIAELEESLIAIREHSAVSEIATMSDALAALEEREANPAAIHKTGLIDLDRQLGGGLRHGQFMIVGGRPGDGKSVLTTQVGSEYAKRGEPSLIISLEMQRSEIAYRLSKAINRDSLRGLPLFIVDKSPDVSRMAALIRLAHRRDAIKLAIVDYLQLVPPSDKRIPREQQVAEVSRTLKQLAMELSIPIIAACQLNRQAAQESRVPQLSDLRESGAIEQDADIVCLIHRNQEAGTAALKVAKNRNGSPGAVPVIFRPDVFRFDNATIETVNL